MSKSKFNLGKITVSFFCQQALSRSGQKYLEFLSLHENCVWGEITKEEAQKNDQIVKNNNKIGKQILAAYITSFHETIWIVTRFEENNCTTTVLLPREYEIIFKK
jgi:hypothetical protein